MLDFGMTYMSDTVYLAVMSQNAQIKTIFDGYERFYEKFLLQLLLN